MTHVPCNLVYLKSDARYLKNTHLKMQDLYVFMCFPVCIKTSPKLFCNIEAGNFPVSFGKNNEFLSIIIENSCFSSVNYVNSGCVSIYYLKFKKSLENIF